MVAIEVTKETPYNSIMGLQANVYCFRMLTKSPELRRQDRTRRGGSVYGIGCPGGETMAQGQCKAPGAILGTVSSRGRARG